MTQSISLSKPKLRGYFHQEAFFIALGACALLVAKGSGSPAHYSSLIYSFSLLFQFGISAVYHRPHWSPRPRAWLKRLDHSAIFVLIAGTFTPFCLLVLPQASGEKLLGLVWGGATVGILLSVFWVTAPKWFSALFYVALGWLVFPFVSELKDALGLWSLGLIFFGGLLYTLGAVFYVMKRPNFVPGVFGYHELFHVLVVLAAAVHFAVVYQIIH
jgi:hemolysin III